MTGRNRDRGSAGVWLLGLCSVLVLAATTSVLVGSAMVTRHKATAAADLSALAAAGKALEGEQVACAAAADIAASMGAALTDCRLSGLVADVSVTVSAELGVVGLASAGASARAGPVDAGVVAGRRASAGTGAVHRHRRRAAALRCDLRTRCDGAAGGPLDSGPSERSCALPVLSSRRH